MTSAAYSNVNQFRSQIIAILLEFVQMGIGTESNLLVSCVSKQNTSGEHARTQFASSVKRKRQQL